MQSLKPSRSARRVPDPWPEWLEGEVRNWVEDGLIEPGQAEAILQAHQVPVKPGPAFQWGMRWVAVLLLAASAVSLVGFSWSAIPPWGRVFLFSAGWLGGLLWARLARGGWVDVALVLSSAFLGAGIWVTVASFHLGVLLPEGQLLWALLVLPFVFSGETPALQYLLMGILAAGLMVDQTLPTWKLLVLPLPLIPSLWWSHQQKQVTLLTFLVVFCGFWMLSVSGLNHWPWLPVMVGAALMLIGENSPYLVYRILGWVFLLFPGVIPGLTLNPAGLLPWGACGVPVAALLVTRMLHPSGKSFKDYVLPGVMLILSILVNVSVSPWTFWLSVLFSGVLTTHLMLLGGKHPALFWLGGVTVLVTILTRFTQGAVGVAPLVWTLALLGMEVTFLLVGYLGRRKT